MFIKSQDERNCDCSTTVELVKVKFFFLLTVRERSELQNQVTLVVIFLQEKMNPVSAE